ncbi:MAG: DUF2779 domain-containing protein [Opitutaceae bacterium]|nr:DUF2779 domain-containing protein [Opitutaceae bacterium]
MHNLSKSKLIAFRQCPKRLWLEIHRPELREDSPTTQASFQAGHQVGEVARRIYDPEGRGALIDAQTEGYAAAFARTERLLSEAKAPIFEAGLHTEGALAFADVMLPVRVKGRRAWRMVEVKSSTSVKDYHHDDVAVQTFIAQAAGVNLHSVAVACIDSAWVYPGGGDYRGLLMETDLTEEAMGRADEVRQWLAEAQAIAAKRREPTVAMGAHCREPFECGFCNYCSRDLPQPEYPVNWLPHLSGRQRTQLEALGVDDLRQVPDALLNGRQRLVKAQTLTNKVYFDAKGAAADLKPHGLPARFLDFETVMFAVPIWAGTRPYQQIPFQFSLHLFTAAGRVTHEEFLDLSGDDPTGPFAKALIQACGQRGPIYVYNVGFERARISELAERYPGLAPELQAINGRLVDLLPIARERYYHPAQQGSWSIKAVLPNAVPEMNYANLEGVQDGSMAMDAYAEAIRPDTPAERKAEIRQQLLAYCGMDTLALVRLWEFFRGGSKG